MKFLSLGRIRFVSFLVIVFSLLILGRLFLLQVVKGEYYRELAERQYVVPSQRVFERGSIFFSERDGGLVSAAGLKTGYFVYITPKDITDAEDVYNKLSAFIPIKKDEFFNKVAKINDPYEEIAHRLPKETADEILALKLKGVSIQKEKWRFYPAGNLAAHTIGFMAYQGNTLKGRYGLERHYESTLYRSDQDLYVNFFAEIFTNLRQSLIKDDFEREGDLVLTIDPSIQSELEKELNTLSSMYSPSLVGGIVMDPKSGAIYALGKLPSFDLNNFKNVLDISVFNNELIEGVYEMGSIMKPLTMAAALDAGVITAETTYYDAGSITLNNRTIYNFDKKGRGTINMQEVLNQSLNTGSVFVMQKLGKEKFKEYVIKYGLGEKTGIDLPNETKGLISNLDTNRDIEYANASFGQGIAVSPIGMIRALASLGNGGYLPSPHVVRAIREKGGFLNEIKPMPGRQVLSKSTSEEISRMLVSVVDKALLEGTVKMEHYSIAAKTGTAQLIRPDGGYYEDRYLHSFFGYFPAYNPKFIIFLYAVDPRGEKYASRTMTYPFIRLTKFLINYYEIPPDR